MRMKKILSILSTLSLFFATTPVTHASGCYVDPVYQYSGTGTVTSAVYLRSEACTSGTMILKTLSAGTPVDVVGFTDGWYEVNAAGKHGWVGVQFLQTNATKTGLSWPSYEQYRMNPPDTTNTTGTTQTAAVADATVLARTVGYILLQVEQHGEAWYVDPISGKRYYMKDGPTAYQMMRSFGLGVSEKDYDTMAAGDYSMKNRLSGRIVLRVQAHGEAYYIHPKDLKMYYLQNGDEAYRIMRLYSLGITDVDLDKITSDSIPIK